MLFNLLLFICVCLVLYLVWDLYRLRHIFRFANKHYSRPFVPIIGNAFHILGDNAFINIRKNFLSKALPCSLWAGHDYIYATADADEIKVILNHPNSFDKSVIYNCTKPVFEHTILLEKFDTWKRKRKLLNKSFSQPILNTFVDVFYKKSCILLDVLKNCENRDKFKVFEYLSLDNFFANLYKIDIDSQIKPKKIVTDLLDVQSVVGKRMFSQYFFPNFLWIYFTKSGRDSLKIFSNFKEFSQQIFNKKKELFKLLQENDEENKKPLVDFLLENEGKHFSNDEIHREIMLFLLAATDTSGVTLAFTFTLLGMNPHIQDKLLEEVKEVVGLDGPIDYNDLLNLKYTEMVLKESMRILPVTPFLGRLTTAEIDLGEKVIPANINVGLCVFDLHRSEKYWENPLEFNPDRFLPEEVKKRHPYCYIPFSAGPRNCIGKTYAMMTMKITLANVIRHYKVISGYKSVEELKLASCITMKTVHDLDVKFLPRVTESL